MSSLSHIGHGVVEAHVVVLHLEAQRRPPGVVDDLAQLDARRVQARLRPRALHVLAVPPKLENGRRRLRHAAVTVYKKLRARLIVFFEKLQSRFVVSEMSRSGRAEWDNRILPNND